MKTPVRIARKRCTSSTAKRGHGERVLPAIRTPSRPRPRAADTRRSPRSGRSTRRSRSCCDGSRDVDSLPRRAVTVTCAVVADEPAGQARGRRATPGPASAEEQRRLRGDVGREAGLRRDRHVAPDARSAGARRAGRSDGSASTPPRSQRALARRCSSRARRRARTMRVAAGEPDDDGIAPPRRRRRRRPSRGRRGASASSTVRPFTTPFRSSIDRLGPQQAAAAEGDRRPRVDRRRLDRSRRPRGRREKSRS